MDKVPPHRNDHERVELPQLAVRIPNETLVRPSSFAELQLASWLYGRRVVDAVVSFVVSEAPSHHALVWMVQWTGVYREPHAALICVDVFVTAKDFGRFLDVTRQFIFVDGTVFSGRIHAPEDKSIADVAIVVAGNPIPDVIVARRNARACDTAYALR